MEAPKRARNAAFRSVAFQSSRRASSAMVGAPAMSASGISSANATLSETMLAGLVARTARSLEAAGSSGRTARLRYAFCMPDRICVYVEKRVDASVQGLRDALLDFEHWPRTFEQTIEAVEHVPAPGGILVLDVHHRRYGKVRNVLSCRADGAIVLHESKPVYDATLVYRFLAQGDTALCKVEADVSLKPRFRWLGFLVPVLGRRSVLNNAILPLARAACRHQAG